MGFSPKDLHIKLDLGSGNPEEGELQPKGFLLQDIEPHKGIDLVCDIEELDKYVEKGQCAHIRISHVLEHFETHKVPVLIKMFHTLLEEGGELEIHVPNLRWHMQLIAEGKDEEAVNYMFGGQKDKYDLHKTGFTVNILRKLLLNAGFSVKEAGEEGSIHIYATK